MILRANAGNLILLAPRIEGAIAVFVTRRETGLEAGGILIGSYRGPHVDVGDCTTPLPGDVRNPHLFDRRDAGHQSAAYAAWKRSGGTDTFVGEWHTHPVNRPVPSSLDLRTWRALMKRTSRSLVFLIAGYESLWCGLALDGRLSQATVVCTS